MVALSLALQVAVLTAPVSHAPLSIPKETPVHLGLSLKLTHVDALNALKRAQQDPKSPDYRRWLTPQEFGDRFGQGDAFEKAQEWLRGAGLRVEPSPNRWFINAWGTAGQIEPLLKVTLLKVADEPDSVHRPSVRPTFPPQLAPYVLGVSGLDTRVRYHHHMNIPGIGPSFGPQDLRRHYNAQPLLDLGYVGQNQKTVVLSTALAPGTEVNPLDVEYFYKNISDVKAPLIINTMFNPQRDYDRQRGGASEFELDVEMHSVGVPGATSITLEVAPASEVFTAGANDIVNTMADATAVSVSLGLCEAGEQQNDATTGANEIGTMHQAIVQGTVEGQTWSAASGDNAANDCGNGVASADFPSTIPEMVAAGGVMPASQNPFNLNGAILTYATETTWNEGNNQRAAGGGGGISILFGLPSYQTPLMSLGTMRMIPDIALIAGGPGVVTDSSGAPGQLDPVLGTSVASPLSAGFFALIASYRGCRLGDPHDALYQMGLIQADGGVAVFHDITTGNLNGGGVTGPAAGPGYDMATGWGAFDVQAMAQNWPACPTTLPDGGFLDAGVDAGIVLDPYTSCGFLGCPSSAPCQTLPDGPSSCVAFCDMSPTSCPMGQVCNKNTIYSTKDAGTCIPGCMNDLDCASDAGMGPQVCSACLQLCQPAGKATANIGDPCTLDNQCPNGAYCSTSRNFPNGYCTQPCSTKATPDQACGCPAGSECGTIGRFPTTTCLAECPQVGEVCRTGYICQPQAKGAPKCLARCTIRTFQGTMFDSCLSSGTTLPCDLDSGICGGPPAIPDAGPMEMDAGSTVTLPEADNHLGAQYKSCGCAAGGAAPLALALLLLARRRSRRSSW